MIPKTQPSYFAEWSRSFWCFDHQNIFLIFLVQCPIKAGRKRSVLRECRLKRAFGSWVENSTKVDTIVSLNSDFSSARSSLAHYFFRKVSPNKLWSGVKPVWVCKSVFSLRCATTDSDCCRNRERGLFLSLQQHFDFQHFFKTANYWDCFFLNK